MLKLHVLASGSKGNAAIVENAATGEGMLIDCGICKRDFLERCDEAGFDPARIDAALITESRAAGLRTPEAVVAMHISQNNNDYDLPRAALEKGLAIAEGNARVHCGYQGRLTSVK